MTAPAWDCYSPVALVLWRAADFAEAGSYSPVSNAAIELGSPGYDGRDRLSPWVMADDLAYPNGRGEIAGASRREWAVALRQLAEFGPAGRPR